MVIDAHHHFWRYSTAEYGWIDDSMSRIARDFLPEDLQKVAATAGVDGVVTVQARQSLEETRWLLELANQAELIRGVVGWAPLADPNIGTVLDEIAHQKLVALRHVVQDEPDDAFILGEAFNQGVSLLAAHNLAYDILIFERHLPQSIQFVDRHPNQRFVLDHLAKPKAAQCELEPWRSNLFELAKRENVVCKVSGLVTEADWSGWSSDSLRVYFDAALEAFGPSRLLFGSDWPVCLVACEYGCWKQTVTDWASGLSDDERRGLFGLNAQRAYQLSAG